jgi:transcriptional regulator NrdR family protein
VLRVLFLCGTLREQKSIRRLCMVEVVKRRGHTERFDRKKMYASVYAACLNAHFNEQQAENAAESITKDVLKAFTKQESVDSRELFEHVLKELKKLNKYAAYMYETHVDVS